MVIWTCILVLSNVWDQNVHYNLKKKGMASISILCAIATEMRELSISSVLATHLRIAPKILERHPKRNLLWKVTYKGSLQQLPGRPESLMTSFSRTRVQTCRQPPWEWHREDRVPGSSDSSSSRLTAYPLVRGRILSTESLGLFLPIVFFFFFLYQKYFQTFRRA